MPSAFYPGFAVYMAAVFVPGFGLFELIGRWKEETTFVEQVGLIFGLGLAVDSLVLFIKTSGVYLYGSRLLGIDVQDVYLIIGIGAAIFLASVAARRRLLLPTRPRKVDFAVLAVTGTLGLMLVLYFAKYPIFPEYQSPDFVNHVVYVEGLTRGTSTSLPIGILYYGVEYQLAMGALLVGGPILVTVRQTMAIMVVLSPMLFYLATSALFKNQLAALVSTAVYVLSGVLWFASVFDVGLYANFFGFLACLFLVAAFVDCGSSRFNARWVVYGAALVLLYLSHYSAITLLPSLIFVCVFEFSRGRNAGMRYLLPTVLIILPVIVVLLLFPHYIDSILNVASGGGGLVVGGTGLSAAAAGVPVLQYLIAEIYDDVGFVTLVALSIVYTYKAAIQRNWPLLLPIFWLITILVASPENSSAWRFSFEAILPLTLLVGQAVAYLIPFDLMNVLASRERRTGKTISRTRRRTGLLIVAVVMSLVIIGSWGTTMLSDSLSGTQTVSTSQGYVYQSIQWLSNNTPANSSYLSVSDWRFTYTQFLIGHNTTYQFESTPGPALAQAKASGSGYIIVTNLVTESLPPVPSLFPWNNFAPSSNLSLIYDNPDVKIFEINQ